MAGLSKPNKSQCLMSRWILCIVILATILDTLSTLTKRSIRGILSRFLFMSDLRSRRSSMFSLNIINSCLPRWKMNTSMLQSLARYLFYACQEIVRQEWLMLFAFRMVDWCEEYKLSTRHHFKCIMITWY